MYLVWLIHEIGGRKRGEASFTYWIVATIATAAVIASLSVYQKPHPSLQTLLADTQSRWSSSKWNRGVRFQNAVNEAATRILGIVNLPDFALEENGGSIDHTTTSRPFWAIESRPEAAIREGSHTGDRWRVAGTKAQLGVSLSEPVRVTNVTVDFINHRSAIHVTEAPQNMTLWGVVEGSKNTAILNSLLQNGSLPVDDAKGPPVQGKYRYTRIMDFSYIVPSPYHVQTFIVPPSIVASELSFGLVVLEIGSNWGAEYTSIYRFRVHGIPL